MKLTVIGKVVVLTLVLADTVGDSLVLCNVDTLELTGSVLRLVDENIVGVVIFGT
jgi:hypothetical protein